MSFEFTGIFAPVSKHPESSLNYTKKGMNPPQNKDRGETKIFNDTINKTDSQKNGQVGQLLDLLNHLYRLKGLTREELNQRFAALKYVTGADSETKFLNQCDAAQIPLLMDSISNIKKAREEQKKNEEKEALKTFHSHSLKILSDYKIDVASLQIGSLQMTELLHKLGDPQAFMEKFINEHLDPYIKGIITRENDDPSRPLLTLELEKKFREKFPTSSISSEGLQELTLDTYIRISVLLYQQTCTMIKQSTFEDIKTMTSLDTEKIKECSSNYAKEIQELQNNFYGELFQALNIDLKLEINTQTKNMIKEKVEAFTKSLKTA